MTAMIRRNLCLGAVLALALSLSLLTACADTPAAGDIITFGRYEQDNDPSDGPEPIEWIVLAVDETAGRALVLSRHGLDALPYNTEQTDASWETCTLRAWLNGEFLTGAFTGEEQAAVLETAVDNSAGQDPWKRDGADTLDRVFLLSWPESRMYFAAKEDALCAPTDHAAAQGAYLSKTVSVGGRAAGVWWFRTPAAGDQSAFGVPDNADWGYNGVSTAFVCVRPALWLDLNAGIF
ncbi:MAG: hypothetical protein IKS31_06405 [Clostridia bacterium]|nr:hypothetical protein [Clostridia bacterium]